MSNANINLLPEGGLLYHLPDFAPKELADGWMHSIINDTKWLQEPITIFGKQIMQPRLTAWYGDSDKRYTYSGTTMHPIPWSNALLELKQTVEVLAQSEFNSALLNLYRNGTDSMGWHRDNEKSLGVDPVIASVSFGATRMFKVRKYKTKDKVLSFQLAHNTLLVMAGTMQTHWEHSVPKTARRAEQRLNITFRKIM